MFWVAWENDIYADSVSEFTRKCIEDVVPTVTLKSSLTRNCGLMAAFAQNWKHIPPHLIMASRLETWPNTNSAAIPSARQSKKQSVSIKTKWSCNSTAQTQDVCGRVYRQSQITKSPVADIDVLLPDKLNSFLGQYSATKTKTVVSPSLWPTWVKHLNVLTLARLPAQTTSSEHAQTNWLVCLRTYSINPYPSLLSPHSSTWPPLFLFPIKLR